MKRICRYVPLSQQPLVLVLCQVKFSPVRQMADYIPPIQEEFRRHGYPLEKAGKIQQLSITPTGMQTTSQERWEYRTKDERWSILVMQDAVVLQTTGYERFEDFAKQLELAVGTVLRVAKQARQSIRYLARRGVFQPPGDGVRLVPGDVEHIGQEPLPQSMASDQRARRLLSFRRQRDAVVGMVSHPSTLHQLFHHLVD